MYIFIYLFGMESSVCSNVLNGLLQVDKLKRTPGSLDNLLEQLDILILQEGDAFALAESLNTLEMTLLYAK